MENETFNHMVFKEYCIEVQQKVVVAIVEGEDIKKSTREFSTFTSSLTELRECLLE